MSVLYIVLLLFPLGRPFSMNIPDRLLVVWRTENNRELGWRVLGMTKPGTFFLALEKKLKETKEKTCGIGARLEP